MLYLLYLYTLLTTALCLLSGAHMLRSERRKALYASFSARPCMLHLVQGHALGARERRACGLYVWQYRQAQGASVRTRSERHKSL